MGWASATGIVEDIWQAVREYIPENKRVEVIKQIMEPFIMADWDTVREFTYQYPEAEQAYEEWRGAYEERRKGG